MLYTVFIHNMVSDKNKLVVTMLFEEFRLSPVRVDNGLVLLPFKPAPDVMSDLRQKLERSGFSIAANRKTEITGRIKSLLSELLEGEIAGYKIKMSSFLSKTLNYEYHYLSSLFSEVENCSIEKFYIRLKTEKVKGLIRNEKMSLGDIACHLAYSSQSHMTSQFKRVTGLTPSVYRTMKRKRPHVQ
jgi:AraC family transcriptional regulator